MNDRDTKKKQKEKREKSHIRDAPTQPKQEKCASNTTRINRGGAQNCRKGRGDQNGRRSNSIIRNRKRQGEWVMLSHQDARGRKSRKVKPEYAKAKE